ncbi:YwmB family TATA-box binding protein [Scopulibacillus cellulosilyticus]|uniref:YwmB family TATA-box binding protein n=1 Tax=Scopulibacillus cellulosilyticus TaxID=2665665 RepID=A0ABW2PU80_9BACL
MKRSNILAVFFIIIFFFGAYSYSSAETGSHEKASFHKLETLADAVRDQGAHVTRWSLYARETSLQLKHPSEFYEQAKHLKKNFPEYTWQSVAKEQGYYQITGYRIIPNTEVKESVSFFAYPQNNNYKTYIIYEVQGNKWNIKSWRSYTPEIATKLSKIFTGKETIFTCVNGKYSDTMKSGLSKRVEQVLAHFSAEKVEQDNEKTFVSVSAYNRQWKDSIETNQRKMNLQVALRTVGSATSITIGTPIITSEY